ncbi:MAG: hypothetical protein ABIO91_02395 [Pyrinomonadaceae bacterium]
MEDEAGGLRGVESRYDDVGRHHGKEDGRWKYEVIHMIECKDLTTPMQK